MMLAIVRSGAWEWALFFHVLGALLLVGGVVLVSVAAVTSARDLPVDSAVALRRLGFRALLFVVIPSFVLMRLAAEWVRSEDGFADDTEWIGIGYMVSDAGVVVLIALALLGWRSLRHAERTGRAVSLVARANAVLAPAYLLALLIAVWAMTTKPD
jgi:hypothetical protein